MQYQQILPPPGRSGSPGPGGGRYRPVKTAALSESPSTSDTGVRAEEAIEDTPLSPSGCGVDDDLTADGHNKVDARSRGRSRLLALSARRRRIIDPGRFLTGGPPATRRGDRGAVPLQDRSPSTASSPPQRTSPEAGFQGEGLASGRTDNGKAAGGRKGSSAQSLTLSRYPQRRSAALALLPEDGNRPLPIDDATRPSSPPQRTRYSYSNRSDGRYVAEGSSSASSSTSRVTSSRDWESRAERMRKLGAKSPAKRRIVATLKPVLAERWAKKRADGDSGDAKIGKDGKEPPRTSPEDAEEHWRRRPRSGESSSGGGDSQNPLVRSTDLPAAKRAVSRIRDHPVIKHRMTRGGSSAVRWTMPHSMGSQAIRREELPLRDSVAVHPKPAAGMRPAVRGAWFPGEGDQEDGFRDDQRRPLGRDREFQNARSTVNSLVGDGGRDEWGGHRPVVLPDPLVNRREAVPAKTGQSSLDKNAGNSSDKGPMWMKRYPPDASDSDGEDPRPSPGGGCEALSPLQERASLPITPLLSMEEIGGMTVR